MHVMYRIGSDGDALKRSSQVTTILCESERLISIAHIGGLQSLSSYHKTPTQNHNLLHVARKNGGTVQEIVQQLEINPPRPGELIDSLL